MPLAPWIRASQSSSMSQTIQNGLASLPATNAKSIWRTPSPETRLTNRWPKISTTSRTPDTRMYSHPHFSQFTRRFLTGVTGERGASIVVMSLPLEFGGDGRELVRQEAGEQHDP